MGLPACRYCRSRFKHAFDHMPLEVALRAPPARVDPIMYLPVPLHPCAFGWHSYWIKCWQGSGPYPVPAWAPVEDGTLRKSWKDRRAWVGA